MPIPVIYLLGTSFSGSTFLSATLSMHPKVENAGQLHRMIVQKKVPDRRICSCGETLSDCPFWVTVWQNWYAQVGSEDVSRYRHLILRYERLRSAWRLARENLRPSQTIVAYHRQTVAMLNAVAEASGREVIVDASKYPGRGLALSKVEGLDVYYIHLVRNGMAYMSSVLKRRKNTRYANRGTFGLVLQSSLEWVLINLASEFVLKTSGRPGIRLRHEDFTSQPEESIQLVGNLIGLDLDEVGDHLSRGEAVSFRHATGNNFRQKGPVPLRIDQQWSSRLPPYAPLIFRMIAGWLASRYGYHSSGK